MFESLALDVSPDDSDEPMPGNADYETFVIYEAQKAAYWSAYTSGDAPPTGPNTDAGLLARAARADRAENQAVGVKLRAVSDFALRGVANPEIGLDENFLLRSVEAQVGFMLRVSASEASDLLDLAMTLTRRLRGTFALLELGEIGLRKVRAIAEETANLTVAQCAQLEAKVLAEAPMRTVRSLREKTRREVERLDADAVRKRKEAARAERTLYLKDEHDGMATLCAYLPAEQARLILDAINGRIPAQHGKDDPRALGARRVDHFVATLATALGIDLHSAADVDTPVLTAEQIARLDRGANSYVPSTAMKTAIRARDKHCRFPGCRRPAVHCDIDHTKPFDLAFKSGGRTIYTNLGCVCRFHHQIKQFTGWHCTQDQAGNFTWTDPGGRTFTTRPPPADGEEPPEFWAPEEDPDPFPF